MKSRGQNRDAILGLFFDPFFDIFLHFLTFFKNAKGYGITRGKNGGPLGKKNIEKWTSFFSSLSSKLEGVNFWGPCITTGTCQKFIPVIALLGSKNWSKIDVLERFLPLFGIFLYFFLQVLAEFGHFFANFFQKTANFRLPKGTGLLGVLTPPSDFGKKKVDLYPQKTAKIAVFHDLGGDKRVRDYSGFDPPPKSFCNGSYKIVIFWQNPIF